MSKADLMIIVVLTPISAIFTMIYFKLLDLENELKKQNEYWQNIDKHMDNVVRTWIKITKNVGGKDD